MTNLVRVGDGKPDLQLTVKNRKGQVVDVSTAKVDSCVGRVRFVGEVTDHITPRAVTYETDGVDGRVNWSFLPADFTAGTVKTGDIIFWLHTVFTSGTKPLQSDKLYFSVVDIDE